MLNFDFFFGFYLEFFLFLFVGFFVFEFYGFVFFCFCFINIYVKKIMYRFFIFIVFLSINGVIVCFY